MPALRGFAWRSLVPRSLAELRHGAVVGEVLHFEYNCICIGGMSWRVVVKMKHVNTVEDILCSESACASAYRKDAFVLRCISEYHGGTEGNDFRHLWGV